MKKLLFLTALLATIVPAIFVVEKAGGLSQWQGVLPRGTTDSLYYYSRMKEVADGHPLIGNPYVYEYRDTYAPAFFLPDIISAIPLILGIPFDIAIAINMFVWSFVFLLLAFKLFRKLELNERWALGFTIILYITAYSFIIRPTVMQLIYPLFLVFLIKLIDFLKEPALRKNILGLALVSAATFYSYTYLSYIAVLSLAFIFFWFLFTRRYIELRALFQLGIYSALMLLPFGIYSIFQMGNPYYFETLNRIGLLYTHIPSREAFLYGRWIVVGLALLFLIKSEKKIFWLSTAIGLLASIFLNVITGVELLLGVHIGRFIVLWMVMVGGGLLYEFYGLTRTETGKLKYIATILVLLVLTVGVTRNISRGLDFFKFDNRRVDKVEDVQQYAGPLKWLEENEKEEAVIWANRSISEYIPIMTRHYPLYFHGAVLHNISGQELEERKNVGPNDKVLLDKFNASFIVIDRESDNAKGLNLNEALYDDGRFAILGTHD